MVFLLLLPVVVLTACISQDVQLVTRSLEMHTAEPVSVTSSFAQSGSVFSGKFATVSALNSHRSFLADYHGDVRITVFPTEQIRCTWLVEGRVEDLKPIEAYATLCAGRLQKDGSFELRGAFSSSGEGIPVGDQSDTFTLRGTLKKDTIDGELVIGSVFGNDVTLAGTDTRIIDAGTGVRYEAVRLEE